MKQYASYKDIDIWWINKIPASWKIIKSHYLFFPVSRKGYPDAELLSVYRDFGVIPRYSRDDNYNRPSDDLSNYKFVEKGDLVFNKMKTWQGSLGISDYAGIVSPAYIVCKPRQQIYGKYFHHLYRSKGYIKELARLSYGIRPNQWDLRYEDFAEIPALIPPLNEQKTIANYLDHKTDQIDTLIEKKQKQIELLKEQRTAIINHAVTKGLNPDVKMKDSGIEWLGEIPVHWTLLPLRRGIEFLTDFESNGSFSSLKDNVNVNTEDPYAWYVRATDLENKRYGNVEGNHFCDKSTYDFLKKTTLYGGELLITKRGEIGKLYLMPKIELPATLAPNLYLIRLDAKRLYPRFTFHWFSSNFGNPQLVLANKSTTIGALYKNDIKDCLCLFPPLKEQKSIANYLDEETLKITNSILKYETQIEYIKEYRTALISDAVTGKIDVRNEVPQ